MNLTSPKDNFGENLISLQTPSPCKLIFRGEFEYSPIALEGGNVECPTLIINKKSKMIIAWRTKENWLKSYLNETLPTVICTPPNKEFHNSKSMTTGHRETKPKHTSYEG